MMFEADCTRCGNRYLFHSMGLGETDHRTPPPGSNLPCNGLPKRIYEVHTSEESLLTALVERMLEPKKPWPLIRYRPRYLLNQPYADVELRVLQFLAEEQRFPTLHKLFNS